MTRSSTDTLIIHCSATTPKMDIGAKEIDRMHRMRGFRKIGYHWVIRRSGELEQGRLEHDTGAHCRNQHMNRRSIGVCLVGGVRLAADRKLRPEDNFTLQQWATLGNLVSDIVSRFPTIERICGHRDVLGVKKDCPSFDVREWILTTMPNIDHQLVKEGPVR